MASLRRLAALFFGIVLVASCGSSDGSGPAAAPTSEPAAPTESSDPAAPRASSATSLPPEAGAEPDDQLIEAPLAEQARELPSQDIDFDGVYRELDAIRTEAWNRSDPIGLELASSDAADLDVIRNRAAEGHRPGGDTVYTIDSVEVFHVIDDDNVYLHVVDTFTGTSTLLNDDGEIVEDYGSRDRPTGAFLVWMERTEDDRWKIARDIPLAPAFPTSIDDFADETMTDGEFPMTARALDKGDTFCALVVHHDASPGADCFILRAQGTASFRAAVWFSVSRDGQAEGFVTAAVGEIGDDPLVATMVVTDSEAEAPTVLAEVPHDRLVGDYTWAAATASPNEWRTVAWRPDNDPTPTGTVDLDFEPIYANWGLEAP